MDPKLFAAAVADPKHPYPDWLRACAVEYLKAPEQWEQQYAMQAALPVPARTGETN